MLKNSLLLLRSSKTNFPTAFCIRSLRYFSSNLVFISIMVVWFMSYNLWIFRPIYCWDRRFFINLRQRLYEFWFVCSHYFTLFTLIVKRLNLLLCFADHLVYFFTELNSHILLSYLFFNYLFRLLLTNYCFRVLKIIYLAF